MHEFSMMESIIKCANESAEQSGASYVIEINISVGKLTQAIPDALEFAFDVLKKDTLCHSATLNINTIEGKIRCLSCGEEFNPVVFRLSCPKCKSLETETIEGKELNIDSIEIEVPD